MGGISLSFVLANKASCSLGNAASLTNPLPIYPARVTEQKNETMKGDKSSMKQWGSARQRSGLTCKVYWKSPETQLMLIANGVVKTLCGQSMNAACPAVVGHTNSTVVPAVRWCLVRIMISTDSWIGKGVEGSGCNTIWLNTPTFAWRNWRKETPYMRAGIWNRNACILISVQSWINWVHK